MILTTAPRRAPQASNVDERVGRSATSHGAPASVSALVCTRDRGSNVVGAVRSLLATLPGPEAVLVVDQSCDDRTEQALARFRGDARFQYVRSSTVGLGLAQNIGLQRLTADIVAITDDDCSVPPDWLGAMVAPFHARPSTAVLFCDVISASHDPVTGFVPASRERASRLISSLREKHELQCMGAGMAVRRETVLSLGGFDEWLGPGARFPSAGDRDIAMRALIAGYSVEHTTDTAVVHDGFRTWHEGRALARRDWLGVGAAYAKPLRVGQWTFLTVIRRELWSDVISPLLGPLRRLQRPAGATRLLYFVRGFALGLVTPLDKRTLRFKSDRNEQRGHPEVAERYRDVAARRERGGGPMRLPAAVRSSTRR